VGGRWHWAAVSGRVKARRQVGHPQKNSGIQARGGRHSEDHQKCKAGPKQAATLAAPGFLAGVSSPNCLRTVSGSDVATATAGRAR
jgi:hypothetical protein